ncbi:proline-rich receptor-like protein kinase PERK2 [Cryptomeria japonica]|uniref:proline-rich receptor-like protein kinase PERK2 n=1 Tax=Cryptomeria japonica TaxID=3369 RepID=UPI0027DA68F4|nr:proline-rich receptor-like protein kinase PERK2 [Cryptomeria japonica]
MGPLPCCKPRRLPPAPFRPLPTAFFSPHMQLSLAPTGPPAPADSSLWPHRRALPPALLVVVGLPTASASSMRFPDHYFARRPLRFLRPPPLVVSPTTRLRPGRRPLLASPACRWLLPPTVGFSHYRRPPCNPTSSPASLSELPATMAHTTTRPAPLPRRAPPPGHLDYQK